ncbi:hypothetical protein HG535_0A02740 [Zygotorulaspora mrakii]|uniref:Protein BZZ1 n=1 Tax=Zygotorulaspora mrakii TaxID=42260 RepID=A0A7H9AVM0_ZYGMR|nr:uncharacterized protein HG535_0A02740 [Zygotorulaspora mrakii]QLG70335.1 hypothetical protein HG535_0A02740 [Zygotorulaspora mrakii]
MSESFSIGNEIKDSYKETQNWASNNVKWLKDIEAFYRDRAKLEKEYSEKLDHLSKEYAAKKSTVSVSLSVGDTPKVTPGSLEAACLVAWNEVLSQTSFISQDHSQLSKEFDNVIAHQLSGLNAKLDMTLSKINGFNGEVTDKRDAIYSELEKAKKNYDDVCMAMEAARSKHTKSPNDRNKRKLEEKETEMNIAKNEYLIKINQANRVKDKYFFQDVPEVVDLLQDLNESRILFLNTIWTSASSVEIAASDNIIKRLESANSVIAQNKPSMNTAMFIKHNLKNWNEPTDFRYQPSAVWHDDDKFAVPTHTELNDLRIKLAKSEKDYNKFHDLSQSELSRLSSLNQKKRELKSSENSLDGQDFYETLKSYLSVVMSFTSHETLKLKAEVEIESIQNNVPSNMDLSTDDIDLSRLKKKTGILSKLKKNILNTESKSGNSSSFFGAITSHTHDFGGKENSSENDGADNYSIKNAATTSKHAVPSKSNNNKVLFAYSKQDSDETTISVGDSVTLEVPDTGSGWTKVRNNTTGESGLVPSTYVEINEETPSKNGNSNAPQVPPPRRTTLPTRILTAQYDYEAQGDDEISISAGDAIEVIRGDDGSGWTYGQLNGAKGLFPTTYCT